MDYLTGHEYYLCYVLDEFSDEDYSPVSVLLILDCFGREFSSDR